MADIKKYNIEYLQGEPELPDTAYDALVKQTQRSPEVSLIKQKNPMLSLEKAYSEAEINKFLDRVGPGTLIMQPKIDGLGVSCVYEKGVFQRATTRGEDITAKIQDLIPKKIQAPRCELRGELFLEKTVFKELKKLHPKYKNPRNTIAEFVNSSEGKDLINTYGTIVFFEALF